MIVNYSCKCLLGFIGRDCGIDFNECFLNLCFNNVICFDLVGNYICNCLFGFIGRNCGVNINECFLNLCRN